MGAVASASTAVATMDMAPASYVAPPVLSEKPFFTLADASDPRPPAFATAHWISNAVQRYLIHTPAAQTFFNTSVSDALVAPGGAGLEARLFGSLDLFVKAQTDVAPFGTGLSAPVSVAVATHTVLNGQPLTLLTFRTAAEMREYQKMGQWWQRIDPDGDLHVPLLTLTTAVDDKRHVLASLGGAEQPFLTLDADTLRLWDVATFLNRIHDMDGMRLRADSTAADVVWSKRHGVRLRNLAAVERSASDMIPSHLCAAIHGLIRGKYGASDALDASTTYTTLAATVHSYAAKKGMPVPADPPQPFSAFAKTHARFIINHVRTALAGETLAAACDGTADDAIIEWRLFGDGVTYKRLHDVVDNTHLALWRESTTPVAVHTFLSFYDAVPFWQAAADWRTIDPTTSLHMPLYTTKRGVPYAGGVALIGEFGHATLPSLHRANPVAARASAKTAGQLADFLEASKRVTFSATFAFNDVACDARACRVHNLLALAGRHAEPAPPRRFLAQIKAAIRDMYADDTFPMRSVDVGVAHEDKAPVALTEDVRSARDAFLAQVMAAETSQEVAALLRRVNARVYQPWTSAPRKLVTPAPVGVLVLAITGAVSVARRLRASTVRIGQCVVSRRPFGTQSLSLQPFSSVVVFAGVRGSLSLQQALHIIYRAPRVVDRAVSNMLWRMQEHVFGHVLNRIQHSASTVAVLPFSKHMMVYVQDFPTIIPRQVIDALRRFDVAVCPCSMVFENMSAHAFSLVFDKPQSKTYYIDSGCKRPSPIIEQKLLAVIRSICLQAGTDALHLTYVSDAFANDAEITPQTVAHQFGAPDDILHVTHTCGYWRMLWIYLRCTHPCNVDVSAVISSVAERVTGMNVLTQDVASFLLLRFMLDVLLSCTFRLKPNGAVFVNGKPYNDADTAKLLADIIRDGPDAVRPGDVTVRQFSTRVSLLEKHTRHAWHLCRTLSRCPRKLYVDRPQTLPLTEPWLGVHDAYVVIQRRNGIRVHVVEHNYVLRHVRLDGVREAFLKQLFNPKETMRVFTTALVCVAVLFSDNRLVADSLENEPWFTRLVVAANKMCLPVG